MKIIKKQDGNIVTFSLVGWLDAQSAPELEAAIESIPENAEKLIFDCSSLEYVSSAGIRQFVAAHKLMNGELTIESLSPEIMDILKMTGLDKKLNVTVQDPKGSE